MTKLQQLRSEIAKVVPEIVELKRGCRIRKNSVVYYAKQWSTPTETYLVGEINDMDKPKYVRLDEPYEVLGRPITLEDVLIAVELSGKNEYGGIRSDGHFLIDFGEKTAWTDDDMTAIKWQLGKSLDQQSEATIDFLYKLICTKI